MADSERIFGDWIVITPAEHDAIVKAYDEVGLLPGTGDGGKKLGEVLSPIMAPAYPGNRFPGHSWNILVVKPNGEPHEIPGTDKVAITPSWDKNTIYVMPKVLHHADNPILSGKVVDDRYPLLRDLLRDPKISIIPGTAS